MSAISDEELQAIRERDANWSGIAWEHVTDRRKLLAATDALQAQVARLREALTGLEAALRKDSRDKAILPDTVEYHLDGQTMYQAINAARAALAPGAK